MIAKDFILTKENRLITAKILRGNKILRGHSGETAGFPKSAEPLADKPRSGRYARGER
jgi:hypothetical protein